MSQLSASINKSNSRSSSPTNADLSASLASPFATDTSILSTPAALAPNVDTKPSVTFATTGMQEESTGEFFSKLYSVTGGGSEVNNETNVSIPKNLAETLSSTLNLDPTSCILIDIDPSEIGIKVCGGLMGASKARFCTKAVTENDGTCGTASHADNKIEVTGFTTFISNKGPNGRKTSAFCKPFIPSANKYITDSMKTEGKTYAEWSGILQNTANTISLDTQTTQAPSTINKVLKASQYIGVTPKKGGTPFTDEFIKELGANKFEIPDELKDNVMEGDSVKVDLTKEDFRRLLKSHMEETYRLSASVKRLSTMLLERFEVANSQIGVLTNNIGINNPGQDNLGYSDVWTALETFDNMLGMNAVFNKELEDKINDINNLQLSNKLKELAKAQTTFLEDWKIEVAPGLKLHHTLYNMLTGPSLSPGKLLMDKISEISSDIITLKAKVATSAKTAVPQQKTVSTISSSVSTGSLFGVPFGPSTGATSASPSVPNTPIEVELQELREEMKQVSARVGAEVVQFGEHTFRSLNEMHEFVNREMGSEPTWMGFFDINSYLDVMRQGYTDIADSLTMRFQAKRIGHQGREAAIIAESFNNELPSVFALETANGTSRESTVHPLPGIKKYENWNASQGLGGVKRTIENGDRELNARTRSSLLTIFQGKPAVQSLAQAYLANCQHFLLKMIRFMEDMYMDLQLDSGAGASEAWTLVATSIREVFRWLREVRCPAENAHEHDSQAIATATILWYSGKCHNRMSELIQSEFKFHSVVTNAMNHHLFSYRVPKVDHEKALVRINKLETTVRDYRKELDSMKSQITVLKNSVNKRRTGNRNNNNEGGNGGGANDQS